MNIKDLVIEKFRKNKEFSKNFVWRLLQTVGKQGTSFVLFLIATYFLSKEDLGIYSYVFSFVNLLAIFADFGISTATSKYVAEYNTVNKEKLPRVFFNSTLLILVISLIVTAVTLLWGERWVGEYYPYLLIILPLVFFSPMTALYDGIYRGLKKFKELSVISLLTGGISLVVVFFLVYQYRLTGALLAQNFLYITYFIILALRYNGFELKVDRKVLNDIGRYSLAFGIATLGYYLFSRINLIILGRYGYFEELATYELINKFFTVYLIPFSIVGQVIAPTLTETFALKKFDQVRRLYKQFVLIFSGIAVISIPVTFVAIKLGVSILFPQYDTDVFLMLLIPVTITYAQMSFSAPINSGIIVSTGYAGISTVMNVIAGGFNLIAALLAVQYFGYLGVVWTTLFTQTVSLITLNLIFNSKLKKLK